MLGPSSSELIFVGARFPPCMKFVESVPPSTDFGCKTVLAHQNMANLWDDDAGMNNTANPPTSSCSLEDLCSFGGKPFFRGIIMQFIQSRMQGFHGKNPNQWFRWDKLSPSACGILTVTQVYNTHFRTRWPSSLASQHGCASLLIWSGKSISHMSRNVIILYLIQVEREMGSAGFLITYFSAGIFG